jgi:hypothetical protein
VANQFQSKCHCGSGRKARYCCLREQANARNLINIRESLIPAARKSVVKRLKTVLLKRVDKEDVLDAWQYFGSEDFGDIPEQMLPLFMPWFLYRWNLAPVSEDLALHLDGRGSVAHKLLKQSRSSMSKYEIACLEKGMKTPLSFFKILDSDSVANVTFIDLLKDDPVEMKVCDKNFAQSARVGGIFFGFIIHDEGVATCEGIAPLIIPPGIEATIKGLQKDLKENCSVINDETMLKSEDLIIDFYWYIDHLLHLPPTIQNTSGELLRLQTLHFDCADQRQAVTGLAPLARDPKLIEDINTQLKAQSLDEVVKFPWRSSKPSKKLNGPVLYGNFEISRSKITVHVNSDERAKRCIREIKQRLGDAATYSATVFDSAERPGPNLPKNLEPSPGIPPEAMQALTQMAAARKKRWFDQPIPMLGGLSPRQASKTSEGRKKLENLIETYNFNHFPDSPNNLSSLMNPTEDEIRLELNL